MNEVINETTENNIKGKNNFHHLLPLPSIVNGYQTIEDLEKVESMRRENSNEFYTYLLKLISSLDSDCNPFPISRRLIARL
jgi:hypothetical protein